ncbi:MAG: XRE family transcriptional regulator [Firmicutes bacterium]|nr:XRE family transcriptional regulator [Bacillota bacterium]
MTKMQQIASRIIELREILGIKESELAAKCKIDIETYLKYESAELDMPISVLYGVSAALNVDPTVILTGDAPKMTNYTVVRKGKGVKVDRYKGYSFRSLAFNYDNRDMEPMIVNIKKTTPPNLVVHKGQEFNLVLKGTVLVTVAENKITLEKGDSIYFDASVLHGQEAITDTAQFLTVINEYSISRSGQ